MTMTITTRLLATAVLLFVHTNNIVVGKQLLRSSATKVVAGNKQQQQKKNDINKNNIRRTLFGSIDDNTEETTVCPDRSPKTGDACSGTTGSDSCGYKPFSCPGSSNVFDTYRCSCDGDTFSCFSKGISCGPLPPSKGGEPLLDEEREKSNEKRYTNEDGSTICPLSEPQPGAKCFGTTGAEPCGYRPFSCPGQEEFNIYSCECFGGSFACFSYAMTPCETQQPSLPTTTESPSPKIDDAVVVGKVCPDYVPTSDDVCSLDGDDSPCLYNAIVCPGSFEIKYTHECYCTGGSYECVVSLIVCDDDTTGGNPAPKTKPPKGDDVATTCPQSVPTYNDACSLEDACLYDPVICPGDELYYTNQCHCIDEAFTCVVSTVICDEDDNNDVLIGGEEPTTEPPAIPTDEFCPDSEPESGVTQCTPDSDATFLDDDITLCLYRPYTCPGQTEENYLIQCFCDTFSNTFQCINYNLDCPLTPQPSGSQQPSVQPSTDTIDSTCIPCTDIPSKGLAKKDKACVNAFRPKNRSKNLEKRCTKSKKWKANQYCQLTCDLAGFGYSEQRCCDVPVTSGTQNLN